MGHLRAVPLFGSAVTTVRDVACRAPRSACGREERATGHALIFTRSGVFVKHGAAGGRREVTADAAHVLFLNEGEAYRVSHPARGGDDSTVLAFPAEVAREVAGGHERRAWRDDAPPFGVTHALVAPEVQLRLRDLRAALRGGTAGALAAEEEALGILDAVARAGVRAHGSGPAAPRRPSTRRARRDAAEAVKEILARSPATAVSLAELGRAVAMSPHHLARSFHAEVGLPVHQYLLRLRLALSLERLADPTVGLSAVALDLGFASHAHFSGAFRRVYGATPSGVRRRLARRSDRRASRAHPWPAGG